MSSFSGYSPAFHQHRICEGDFEVYSGADGHQDLSPTPYYNHWDTGSVRFFSNGGRLLAQYIFRRHLCIYCAVCICTILCNVMLWLHLILAEDELTFVHLISQCMHGYSGFNAIQYSLDEVKVRTLSVGVGR